MITITNNNFQDLNNAIAAGLFLANAKPKKAALYEAIAAHNEEHDRQPVDMHTSIQPDSQPLSLDIPTLEAGGNEAALQSALLAMDAVEDAAQAEQQAPVKAMKKTRKLVPIEQAQKNAQDLAEYRRIVELKEAIGAGKAAEQLTAAGRKMGGTTVCQIAATYYKVLMASLIIQQLFNDGLVTWGELYSRSRRINIAAIEAEFNARFPQAS